MLATNTISKIRNNQHNVNYRYLLSIYYTNGRDELFGCDDLNELRKFSRNRKQSIVSIFLFDTVENCEV